jgi:hypothetical protein
MSAYRPTGDVEFVLIAEIDQEMVGTASRRPVIYPNQMVDIARQEGLALWINQDERLYILCLPNEVHDVLALYYEGRLQEMAPVESESVEPVQRQSRLVRQSVRSYTFGNRVKEAYLRTCLICGNNDPRVMIGAHINPVNSPTSNDETENGACLCSQCHILFDAHDIVLHTDYTLEYSERILNLLPTASHHADYLNSLPDALQFPEDVAMRPSSTMIALRNEFFGIGY